MYNDHIRLNGKRVAPIRSVNWTFFR